MWTRAVLVGSFFLTIIVFLFARLNLLPGQPFSEVTPLHAKEFRAARDGEKVVGIEVLIPMDPQQFKDKSIPSQLNIRAEMPKDMSNLWRFSYMDGYVSEGKGLVLMGKEDQPVLVDDPKAKSPEMGMWLLQNLSSNRRYVFVLVLSPRDGSPDIASAIRRLQKENTLLQLAALSRGSR